jgi:hypothetical protein
MGGTAGDGGRTTGGFAGARTPEELETLFEDAFVIRDRAALAGLFEERAVLVAGDGRVARGSGAIARLATALWERDRTYVADPRQVVQARDLALILGEGAINVARRGGDGGWRYAIALLCVGDQPETAVTEVGE